MIHFTAFANRNPQETIHDSLTEQWASANVFPNLINRWTYAKGNLFLSIQGDCAISHCVHTSPRLILICHTDLLDSGAGDDLREANQSPASYLARLYEQQGDKFARDLHGWFGIVLYDLKQNALKAWTDHFGVRRIVYRETSGGLGIASDLRLLNGLFAQSPEIDPQAILEYLQYTCIPAPRTIYKNTFRLKPGCQLASQREVVTKPYWDIKYEELEGRSLKTWAAETFDAIKSAVARAAKTLDDSKHVGCFLSGGTDSSSVSGLVGQITGERPKTFSIGFEDPRYSEISYARIAARQFNADHHEYFVKPQDILTLLPKATQAYDEPFGNSSIIPAYYCAQLAADNNVLQILAGDGGDELFGGNQRYANDRVFQRYAYIPSFFRTSVLEPSLEFAARHTALAVLNRAVRYSRRAKIPMPERIFSYDFLSSTPRSEVFESSFLAAVDGISPLSPAKAHYSQSQAKSDLNRWLYLDLKITITDNDVRKVTAMTELAGIVARYPFLNPSLAEFSSKVPGDLKVKGDQLRYLFKKAMAKLLPLEIIKKQKHGFGLPYSTWLGEYTALKDLTFDTLTSTECQQRGYFRKDLLDWLWHQYESAHRTFYGDVIWTFLMLELWHRQSPNLQKKAV